MKTPIPWCLFLKENLWTTLSNVDVRKLLRSYRFCKFILFCRSNLKSPYAHTQPPGGVLEGQVFLVPLPQDFAVGEPRVNIPTGHWKDGLFDFLKAGIFHPSLCCACCVTQSELGNHDLFFF